IKLYLGYIRFSCGMVTLSFTAVYIINQVKLRRLILGISARGLARAIEMSDSYVSSIESMATKNQFTINELSKIALVLKCEVRDFYPPDEMLLKNDGSNVLKEIISLADIEGASKVISGMTGIGYFDGSRLDEETTSSGVAKYLDVLGKKEAPVVQQALNNFVANGKLTLTNGSYIQP